MSTQYARLQQSPEDKVYEFLSFNLQEMQLYLRRLPALDAFFKTEALPEQKQQIKGIKADITGIKNGFVKANQKKHEYIARKEEAEQLKRLGITQE